MKNKIKSIHTKNLEHIKKVTGASFVGFQNYKDLYHLRFVKDKKETFYKLTGHPNDITAEGYKKLLDLIIYGDKEANIEQNTNKLGSN